MTDKFDLEKQDILADIKMLFKQIISLSELMPDKNDDSPDILTICDLANIGHSKIILYKKLSQ